MADPNAMRAMADRLLEASVARAEAERQHGDMRFIAAMFLALFIFSLGACIYWQVVNLSTSRDLTECRDARARGIPWHRGVE